jgi:hypothetical protein
MQRRPRGVVLARARSKKTRVERGTAFRMLLAVPTRLEKAHFVVSWPSAMARALEIGLSGHALRRHADALGLSFELPKPQRSQTDPLNGLR